MRRAMVVLAAVIAIANLFSCGSHDSVNTAPSAPAVPIDLIRLQPSAADLARGLFVGDQNRIAIEATDLYGNVLQVPLALASRNSDVASATLVSAQVGAITGVGVGTTYVVATSGTASDSMQVSVDGNVTGSITVVPTEWTLKVGNVVAIGATLRTTLNHPSRGRVPTWSSSDPAKASVTSSGIVTALATTPGITICAAAPDVPAPRACTSVIVTP
jgi:hypothetical protein